MDFRTAELRTAIIYTGEIRTIQKCIYNFKQMVVAGNTHVHAVLQCPPSKEKKTEITQLLFDVLGCHLKSLVWLDKNDETWIKTRDDLLARLPVSIGDNLMDYLRSSGSMIEYYQMYLASKNMKEYETASSFQYQYVMRMRCDVMITEPIRFDNWHCMLTVREMHDILYSINPDYVNSPDTIIKYISSLIAPHRRNAIFSSTCKPMSESVVKSEVFTAKTYDSDFLYALRKYIMTMPFVVTLRCNVVYFTTRDNWVNKLMKLGVSYGQYYDPLNSHWFNAESQLRNVCESSGLDVIDSYLDLECRSLYEYDDANYFDWIQVDDETRVQVMKPDLKKECLFFIRRA